MYALINTAKPSPARRHYRQATLNRQVRRLRGDMKLYVWHGATIKEFHPGGPVSGIWTLAEDVNAAYDMVSQEYGLSWEDLNGAGYRVAVYIGDAIKALEPHLCAKATRPILPSMRLAWPVQVVRKRGNKMYGYASSRHG